MTTAYGGYTKTSYGADAAGEGGGFVGGGAGGGGSQGGGGRNYAEDSLRPVTIKQLLETEESYPGAAEFSIDGAPVTQLTVVGQVRAVNPQSTNVTYQIDDGTGVIDVKKWIDAEKSTDNEAPFAVDQYVRAFGRLKLFNQKRYIAAHFLRGVEDYNEVSYHLLECTYVHLSLTRGTPGSAGAGAAAGAVKGGAGESMFVDQHGGGGTNGGDKRFSPNAQKVYAFLQTMSSGGEGVNANVIANQLKLGYGPTMKAVEELTSQGAIYTTLDDETFTVA